jgi:hypothetical protein
MKILEVPLQVVIMTWFSNIQRKDLNSKNEHKPGYTVKVLWNTVAPTVTLGVSQPSPRKRNLISSFEKEKGPNSNNEQSHVSLYSNLNSGWREWRKSLLSQVASSPE